MPDDNIVQLDIDIPSLEDLKVGSVKSHVFTSGKNVVGKKVSELGQSEIPKNPNRSTIYANLLVALYWHVGGPVPYKFREASGTIRSHDSGCLGHLQKLINFGCDDEGNIVTVTPSQDLIEKHRAVVEFKDYFSDFSKGESQVERKQSEEGGVSRVEPPDAESFSDNPTPLITPQTLNEVEEKAILNGSFDLDNIEDAREKILTNIVIRRGQSGFRNSLIKAYRGCCAISGCDVPEALEAAHIHPYKGDKTNTVSNGLLLRADLHTLFDQNLIAINPTDMTVIIAAKLRNSIYYDFLGQLISLPDAPEERPSKEALKQHLSQSGLA